MTYKKRILWISVYCLKRAWKIGKGVPQLALLYVTYFFLIQIKALLNIGLISVKLGSWLSDIVCNDQHIVRENYVFLILCCKV